MKYIYSCRNGKAKLSLQFFLAAWLLVMASCHSVVKLGRKPLAEPPYVQLKDSSILHPREVGQEMDLSHGMILADDQGYAPKSVLRYSNGEQTFANLHRGYFGPKIADGKIVVYSMSNAAHYGYAPHDYHKQYVQDSGTSKLYYMRYHALRSMIPADAAGSQYLKTFKQNRTIFRLSMVGGFACFIGGAVIAGNAVAKDKSDGVAKAGMTMVFGGMGIMLAADIGLIANKMNLRRAIAARNGMKDED